MDGSGTGRSRFVVLVACVLLVITGACTSPSKEKEADGRGTGTASVMSFGAKGDGVTDDTKAIQAAIDSIPDSGGRITVPTGTYRISEPLVVRRNGLTLRGDGPRSVLKLADGVTRTMFTLPVEFGPNVNSADVVVTDVEVSRLTIDGNKNGQAQIPPTFFGMHLLHAERVILSELVFKDWAFDALAIGVGQKPNVDITIRNSRFSGNGRHAIHLGYGSNLKVSQVYVDDTPSQQWGPAAGSAIDVEVEGQDSFVDGLVIEDSFFERMGTKTAGFGIGLQPAFGPVRNAVVRRNVVRNHQTGVFVAKAEGVEVKDNWILADDSLTTGTGIGVQDGTPKVEGNVLNLLRWSSSFAHAAISTDATAAPRTISGNHLLGGACTFRLNGGGRSVPIEGNTWANSSGCFLDPASQPERVAHSRNDRLPLDSLDQDPPTVTLQRLGASVATSATTIRAMTSDRGAGVARVYFLFDGVPVGFSDSAPYEISVDPAHYVAGEHTVEAVAVDKAANVSLMNSVGVEFRP